MYRSTCSIVLICFGEREATSRATELVGASLGALSQLFILYKVKDCHVTLTKCDCFGKMSSVSFQYSSQQFPGFIFYD